VVYQDNSYRSVTEIEPEHGISAGIHLRSIGNGMVPVYEEHVTRIENNMNLTEWDALPYMERVMVIAVTRVKHAIANLQAEAEIRKNESDIKNRGRK